MAQKVDLSQQNIYGLPVVYTRTNGQPMEETLIWDSYSAAEAYAKTSKAYVGQILSVITDAGEGKSPRYTSKAYIVNSEAGDLVEISGKSFSTIAVSGQNNVVADVVADTLTLAAGDNVTIATNATNDKITISSSYTDTKVTSVGNHYTPSTDTSAELTASISDTAGAYAKDTEYTVVTGVKAQRDAKGHITGLTYTAQKIKDTNTDTKVTSVDNHYTPVKDDTVQLNAVANSSTAATWGTTDLVTGVSLQRDAKGHVTGVTVSSVQMPSDPTTGLNECEGKIKIDGTWYSVKTASPGFATGETNVLTLVI